jgi:hypothetical protein
LLRELRIDDAELLLIRIHEQVGQELRLISSVVGKNGGCKRPLGFRPLLTSVSFTQSGQQFGSDRAQLIEEHGVMAGILLNGCEQVIAHKYREILPGVTTRIVGSTALPLPRRWPK